MEYLSRVLVLCDRMKAQGIQQAHRILQEQHEYQWTERILRRQTAHARLVLILAGAGKIDLIRRIASVRTIQNVRG